ncbi:hypothetical protein ACFLS9_08820 [Bacteroidota bacterium]
MQMVKAFFKWTLRLVILFVAVELLHFTILAYPQPMFSHHINYGNFSVYSDKPIQASHLTVLNDVETRIKETEIYHPDFHANIFLCNNPTLHDMFVFLSGKTGPAQGLNLSLVDNSFINIHFIDQINYYHDRRFKHTHLTGELPHIIAHELIHNLITNHFGWLKSRKLPSWKVEGYCEYGSTISKIKRDTFSNLHKRSSMLFEDDLYGTNPHSKFYYKSQLIVENLVENEGYDFEKLFNPNFNEETAYNKLLNWYKSNVNY